MICTFNESVSSPKGTIGCQPLSISTMYMQF